MKRCLTALTGCSFIAVLGLISCGDNSTSRSKPRVEPTIIVGNGDMPGGLIMATSSSPAASAQDASPASSAATEQSSAAASEATPAPTASPTPKPEVVQITAVATPTEIPATSFEGAKELWDKKSGSDITFQDIPSLSVKIGLAESTMAHVSTFHFAADASGTNDEVSLMIESSKLGGAIVVDSKGTNAGIESIALAYSGSNILNSLSFDKQTTGLKLSGTGSLSLSGAIPASLKKIDATLATGSLSFITESSNLSYAGGEAQDNLLITASNSLATSFTLGKGNDSVILKDDKAQAYAAGFKLDGGDGIDTLIIGDLPVPDAIVGAALIGFEILDISGRAENLNLGNMLDSKITQVNASTLNQVGKSSALDGDVTVSNLDAGAILFLQSDLGAKLTYTLKATVSSQTNNELPLTLSGVVMSGKSSIIANTIENITISSLKSEATNITENTLHGLSMNAATSMKIGGNQALTIASWGSMPLLSSIVSTLEEPINIGTERLPLNLWADATVTLSTKGGAASFFEPNTSTFEMDWTNTKGSSAEATDGTSKDSRLILKGQAGDDQLLSYGISQDFIQPGEGMNTLYPGPGFDTVVLSSATGQDTIRLAPGDGRGIRSVLKSAVSSVNTDSAYAGVTTMIEGSETTTGSVDFVKNFGANDRIALSRSGAIANRLGGTLSTQSVKISDISTTGYSFSTANNGLLFVTVDSTKAEAERLDVATAAGDGKLSPRELIDQLDGNGEGNISFDKGHLTISPCQMGYIAATYAGDTFVYHVADRNCDGKINSGWSTSGSSLMVANIEVEFLSDLKGASLAAANFEFFDDNSAQNRYSCSFKPAVSTSNYNIYSSTGYNLIDLGGGSGDISVHYSSPSEFGDALIGVGTSDKLVFSTGLINHGSTKNPTVSANHTIAETERVLILEPAVADNILNNSTAQSLSLLLKDINTTKMQPNDSMLLVLSSTTPVDGRFYSHIWFYKEQGEPGIQASELSLVTKVEYGSASLPSNFISFE